MTNQYHYCERWFRQKKRPTALIDEAKARSVHEARQLYAVIVGEIESPDCIVEIKGDYIGIGFLDEHKREYLSYQFQEVEPGTVFLTMVTHREFDGVSDTVRRGTTYYFRKDGIVTIEKEDFISQIRSEKKIVADISGNWERYPSFGNYSSLTRLDRENTFPLE